MNVFWFGLLIDDARNETEMAVVQNAVKFSIVSVYFCSIFSYNEAK